MWVLIAGIALLFCELLTGSFYLLWYGLGLFVSGGAGLIFGLDSWMVQSVIGLVLGVILMVLFQRRFSQKEAVIQDEFLLESGEGIIREEGVVEFRGTLWKYETDVPYQKGERVFVTPSGGNRVRIKKLSKD